MDVRVIFATALLAFLCETALGQNGQDCVRNCFFKHGTFHVCGSCTRFIKCVLFILPLYYDCPKGLSFDSKLKKCVVKSSTCYDPTQAPKPFVSYCECNGDPHCKQFDGKWVHFQGSCTYTMVRDKCVGGVPAADPSFHVTTNNIKDRPFDRWSYVREVEVQFPGLGVTINVYQNRRVVINGKEMFGSRQNPHADVEVVITPAAAYIRLKNSVEISYDGRTSVRVKIPQDLKTSLCGICGNANDNDDDDWVVGPSKLCMKKWPNALIGAKTNDLNEFGYSWTHAIDAEATCVRECPEPLPPPGCDTADHTKANDHCNILRSLSGTFGKCLSAMPTAKRTLYFDNCVYDACALKLFDDVVCTHAADMAAYCHDELKILVSYRTSTFCPMECGAGMVYKVCAKPCLPTCEKPDVCDTAILRDGQCEEGCYCKEGFVYNGKDACTPKSDCGCYLKDKKAFIPIGTTFMTEDCGIRFECVNGSKLTSTVVGCKVNEQCTIHEGVHGCHCLSPARQFGGGCFSPKEICEQKKNKGVGTQNIPRYFFNSKKRKCRKFSFKGTGGNANSFETKEACEALCDNFVTPEFCKLPSDVGKESGSPQRAFFYDMSTKSCLVMQYLGSGGNKNRFPNKKKCELECKA